MYIKFFKRSIDFLIALFALVLLSPIFITIIILLYFANNGKPFFFQSRPGHREKVFMIVKFKTMNDKMDSLGNLLADSERLTPIGTLVRKTSLDEIPQLFNVLMGDMSLVGPRPLLVSYLPLYTSKQRSRHNVRPGITGWAQVNGRNAIGWVHKFELDVFYVQHCSFLLDMKIVYLTFVKVFNRDGVNSSENSTMETFRGEH